MAYIYKITNIINNKSYIGKTQIGIKERFKEHEKESKRKRSKDRPLYKAINKYGIENFKIEPIEETDKPEEREVHYIKTYNTYGSTGYNATIGGDGKAWLDHQAIIDCYQIEQSMAKVAEIMGCHRDSVRNILNNNNIIINSSTQVIKSLKGKIVEQYSLEGEYIMTYATLSEAALSMELKYNKKCYYGNISRCAEGNRKTAYGFKWKFV